MKSQSERFDGAFEAGHQEVQRLDQAGAGSADGGDHFPSHDRRLEVEVRIDDIRRNHRGKCVTAARLPQLETVRLRDVKGERVGKRLAEFEKFGNDLRL